MNPRTLLVSAVVLGLFATPASADDQPGEVELLRQQVKELTARLDALERKQTQQQKAQAPQAQAQPQQASSPSPAPAANASLTQRVDAIEQKEAQEPTVQYGEGKGLTVTSPDKDFQLRLSGYFQADNHTFIGGNPSSNTDQTYIRSARPTFDAKIYDNFSARLMFDFGNNQTALLDAYGDYNAADAFNIRVGKFKDPIGIERWQAEKNVLFVERGMTTNLVPYRDNGIGVYGNLIPGTLEYQVALTNGAPDLVNSTNNTDDDQNVTARVFAHPFHNTDNGILKGIGVGVAGSYGNRNASLANTDLTSGYVTPAQTKFFTYNTTAFASGEQWRINPEATYYNGPFSVISEYVLEDQGLRLGSTTKTLGNDAWMLASTYVLTGEDARFDGVVPRNNFDPAHGAWGAFELVGRFSQLHVDPSAFPIFASLATSAKDAQETTLGGTWYLNPSLKLNLDFNVSQFTGGAAGNGNMPTEKAVLTRAQVSF